MLSRVRGIVSARVRAFTSAGPSPSTKPIFTNRRGLGVVQDPLSNKGAEVVNRRAWEAVSPHGKSLSSVSSLACSRAHFGVEVAQGPLGLWLGALHVVAFSWALLKGWLVASAAPGWGGAWKPSPLQE
jgi:hypothetical protein